MPRSPRRRPSSPEGGRTHSTSEATLDGPTPPALIFSRRDLLRIAGGAAVGVAGGVLDPLDELVRLARAAPPGTPLAEILALQEPEGTAPVTASVVRARDFLVLNFRFLNFNLVTVPNQTARLVRTASPAYIIVEFPTQHIAEQAYLESDPNLDPGGGEPLDVPGSVEARLANLSRLAFEVPASVTSIPYLVDEILKWTPFEMSVPSNALPQGAPLPGPMPPPSPPASDETAIEAPYRLIISPNRFGGWAHSIAPVTHADRTELWHTRLGVRVVQAGQASVDEASPDLRTIRAVWSPDFVAAPGPLPPHTNAPFRMSLDGRDRTELVHLTSNYNLGFSPQAVQVDRLMLTSLGAWLNLRGFWDIADINEATPGTFDFTVLEWRHRAAMARDSYVRVVYLGYLLPFGNEAALIKVTERKFQAVPLPAPTAGYMAAYLRQRFFIVVRKPEKTYPATGQQFLGRATPFQRIRITTLVTPSLSDPADPAQDINGRGQDAFWPRVGSADFQFHLVGQDWEGQPVEFSMPLAFISASISDSTPIMAAVTNEYNTTPAWATRRNRPMRAQKIAFAAPSKPGDTSLETNTIMFGATNLTTPAIINLPPGQPRFYPTVQEADVRLQAAEQAAGGALPATVVTLDPTYLQSAFNVAQNRGAVFVRTKNPVALTFPADKSGGVATPNMGISGLSRSYGPVGGDPAAFGGGTFDPTSFFSDAKILGGILLKDIIQSIVPAAFGSAGDKVPKITNRTVYPGDDQLQIPQEIITTLVWKPALKSDPLNIFVVNPGGKTTTMELTAMLVTKLQPPGEPTFEIVGDLRNFRVNMLGVGPTLFLILDFTKLIFTAKSGEKPDVDVAIDSVTFAGVLEFVNALKDFLKSSGNGPYLDITPTQVKAGYELAIPTVGVGVFTLQNISFSAGLIIPFSGEAARVRFAFCARESPFLLTVYGIGGGGFFAIAIGLDGVELLEAALEFGASIAFDIGIAAGEAHIMAGIYFLMEKPGTPQENASLTGYVRLGGSLEILGIITISVEFYMGLTWDITNDEVWGQATLTVEIEILFFSISVELSVERRFAGGGSSGAALGGPRAALGGPRARGLPPPAAPKFADLVSKVDWDVYCDAFAAVP